MKYKLITLIIFLVSFLVCIYLFINEITPTEYINEFSASVPYDSHNSSEEIFKMCKLNGFEYICFIIKHNYIPLSLGWITWLILLIYSVYIFIKQKVTLVGLLLSIFRCHAYFFASVFTLEFFGGFIGNNMDGPSKALFFAELTLFPLTIQFLFYGIISLIFISLVSIRTNVSLKFSLFDIVSLAIIYFDIVLLMLFSFWGIYLF